jgi:hypothetical protein
MLLSQTSQELLTNFLQASYKPFVIFLLHTKVLLNFEQNSYAPLTNFSRASYEFLTSFIQTFADLFFKSFLRVSACQHHNKSELDLLLSAFCSQATQTFNNDCELITRRFLNTTPDALLVQVVDGVMMRKR